MVMCRRRGVKSITIDGVTFHMSDDVPQSSIYIPQSSTTTTTVAPGGITADTKIQTDELTEEQLMFYSARSEAFEGQQ